MKLNQNDTRMFYVVDTNWATARTSLARYLRNYLGLTGTKVSCAQAGCGACAVTATRINPGTGEEVVTSVNSWYVVLS